MFINYIKYLLNTYSFVSYASYKNSVKWKETAVAYTKKLSERRAKINARALKSLKSKKLPLVSKDIKTGLYVYKNDNTKVKGSLKELAKYNAVFVLTNPHQFDVEYINNIKYQNFIKLIYS